MPEPTKMPGKLRVWIDARKRHNLSHAHIQMARELGLNAMELGSLDNDGPEPWKAPLAEFIEELYEQRFGRERPEVVMSIEEKWREQERRKAEKRAAKEAARQNEESGERQTDGP